HTGSRRHRWRPWPALLSATRRSAVAFRSGSRRRPDRTARPAGDGPEPLDRADLVYVEGEDHVARLRVVGGDRDGLTRLESCELGVEDPWTDHDTERPRSAEIHVERQVDLTPVAAPASGRPDRDHRAAARVPLESDPRVVGAIFGRTQAEDRPASLDHRPPGGSTRRGLRCAERVD